MLDFKADQETMKEILFITKKSYIIYSIISIIL